LFSWIIRTIGKRIMRIGLFGGSFDPLHLGHLILAEQCREQARLDQVWFVPAATSPLKQHGPIATNRQRLEILQLGLAGHDAFRIEECELKRGGVSYTVETLRELQANHGGHDWFLLIGGDSLADFARWREPEEICRRALPLVYQRPGHAADLGLLRPYVFAERLAEIEKVAIVARQIEISSTDLRRRLAAGLSVRYLVPRSVEIYLQNNRVYQPAGGS
jgi:nicotinate-nucleotide adenylyltransferase